MKKSVLTRKSNITAQIIADSINCRGERMTSLVIEYPRYVLAELNTHGMLCVNSSSSRSVPFKKQLELNMTNGATPINWGGHKAGMQAAEEIDNLVELFGNMYSREEAWEMSRQSASMFTNAFGEAGYAKEIVNRIHEPYQTMKTVISATEWDNFFNLRYHPDADPNLVRLAHEIFMAMKESTPIHLNEGEWHTPFIKRERDENGVLHYYVDGVELEPQLAADTSCTMAAQVSFRKLDSTLDAIQRIFTRLINDGIIHGSAFAHTAKPIPSYEDKNIIEKTFLMDDTNGISHIDRYHKLWSGQLKGYIQYRKLLPQENCTSFNYDERIKLFED